MHPFTHPVAAAASSAPPSPSPSSAKPCSPACCRACLAWRLRVLLLTCHTSPAGMFLCRPLFAIALNPSPGCGVGPLRPSRANQGMGSTQHPHPYHTSNPSILVMIIFITLSSFDDSTNRVTYLKTCQVLLCTGLGSKLH